MLASAPRRTFGGEPPSYSTRTPAASVLLLCVALGGAAGAYARYRLSRAVYARAGHSFPWGTLAVNLAGSFALGLVLPHLAGGATPLRALVAVGFLGAFTTFSTFAAEAVALLEERRWGRAAGYVAASLALGLAAIAAGVWVGTRLH